MGIYALHAEMMNVKDEYLIWKNLEEQLERDIKGLEDQLFLNKKILKLAKNKIKLQEKKGIKEKIKEELNNVNSK